MSTIITAGNATNNGASISSAADGLIEIKTGTGAGTTAITIDASQNVTMSANLSVTGNTTVTGTLSATNGITGSLKSATAQASTSGTSIDFTGIPSGVKRITVMFSGVSTNGSTNFLIQIGSGSVTTTGYSSGSGVARATTGLFASSTAGFIVVESGAALNAYGQMVLTLVSGNIWVSSHAMTDASSLSMVGGGNITLGGVLDRVRITTVNGTDTFDAGSINIIYE
jgi:hypothetical protein